MFFIAGVSPKVKVSGSAACICPVCGRSVSLYATKRYSVVTLFFVPVLPFGADYIVTCGSCASVMSLSKEQGRALEKNRPVEIHAGDLDVIQNNYVHTQSCSGSGGYVCPRCASRVEQGQNFCPACGGRL